MPEKERIEEDLPGRSIELDPGNHNGWLGCPLVVLHGAHYCPSVT